jgi:hypothetical protein
MMSSLPATICVRNLILAITAFALMGTVPTPVRAETQVAGEADALNVEAHDATVQEILDALSASFGLQYRTSTDLSRSASGTYKGSLREVITRLLDGYDFVVRKSDDHVEIAIIGSSGMTPAAVAAQPSPGPAKRRDF